MNMKGGEGMAVKIVIRRNVPKEKEPELLPMLIQLRALAVSQPGYISGETLRNVDNPEEHLVISTWQGTDSWKSWLSSKQREEIQKRIDSVLGMETQYAIYYYR
jgi:heme-degrading monooxygenase HmoA